MLKTLGITGGIGSLQYGAMKAGFKALGNIEWRKYYHSGTFEHNFKDAWMVEKIEDINEEYLEEELVGVDLAMGHPDCGAFSILNTRWNTDIDENVTVDIPLFMELVERIQPKFFLMDNLPKSLVGNPMESWLEALPDYELFPEFISNHHYGNVQKHRKRFFMIGCRKDIAEETGFVFIPGEFEQPDDLTVKTILTPYLNKYGKFPNHPHPDKKRLLSPLIANKRGTNNIHPKPTLEEAAEIFKEKGPGYQLRYFSHNKGSVQQKPGRSVFWWDGPANTLTGGNDAAFHPKTGYPLTTREKAAIQGFDDDFIFVHKNELTADGKGRELTDLIKQTGKCMPVQFPEFFSKQVKYVILKNKNSPSLIKDAQRLVKPNVNVQEAKMIYCRSKIEAGENPYTNQELACEMCSCNNICEIGEE